MPASTFPIPFPADRVLVGGEWRAAANRPSAKASAVVSSIAIDASGTVTTRRSPTSCAIGVS